MKPTVEDRERKRRRSSILKKSPSRTALTDIDFNSEATENIQFDCTSRKRFSKRVSFANTHEIKEITRVADIAQEWHDSSSDIEISKLSNVSTLLTSIPKRTSQSLSSTSTEVKGLKDLLTSPIADVHQSQDLFDTTTGLCDMDITNVSLSGDNGNMRNDEQEKKMKQFSSVSSRCSFFDNSALDIGDKYIPCSQDTPPDGSKNIMAIPGRSSDTLSFQDFLQSAKLSDQSQPVESPQHIDRVKCLKTMPPENKNEDTNSKPNFGVGDFSKDDMTISTKKKSEGSGIESIESHVSTGGTVRFHDFLQSIKESDESKACMTLSASPVHAAQVDQRSSQQSAVISEQLENQAIGQGDMGSGDNADDMDFTCKHPVHVTIWRLGPDQQTNVDFSSDSRAQAEMNVDSPTQDGMDLTCVVEVSSSSSVITDQPGVDKTSVTQEADMKLRTGVEKTSEDITQIFGLEGESEMDITECLPRERTTKAHMEHSEEQSALLEDIVSTSASGISRQIYSQSNTQENPLHAIDEVEMFRAGDEMNFTTASNTVMQNEGKSVLLDPSAGLDKHSEHEQGNVSSEQGSENEIMESSMKKLVPIEEDKTCFFYVGNDEMDYTATVANNLKERSDGDHTKTSGQESDVTHHFHLDKDLPDTSVKASNSFFGTAVRECNEEETQYFLSNSTAEMDVTQLGNISCQILASNTQPEIAADPSSSSDLEAETIDETCLDSDSKEAEDATCHTISLIKSKISRVRNSIGIYKARNIGNTLKPDQALITDRPLSDDTGKTSSIDIEPEDEGVINQDVCLASLNLDKADDSFLKFCDEVNSSDRCVSDVLISSHSPGSSETEVKISDTRSQDRELKADWDLHLLNKTCEGSSDLFTAPSNYEEEEAFSSRPIYDQDPSEGSKEVFGIKEVISDFAKDPFDEDSISDPVDLDSCSPAKIRRFSAEGNPVSQPFLDPLYVDNVEQKENDQDFNSNSHIQQSLLDLPSTSSTLVKSFAESSIMDDLSRQDQNKKVQNISVEEFLQDYANIRVRDAYIKKSRQSNIMASQTSTTLPENLSELFLGAILKPKELSLYECFIKSMEDKVGRLDVEIQKTEQEMSLKNPKIFHTVRFGDPDDSEALVGGIQKLSSRSKVLGKAYWKLDASKLHKGLSKSAEEFVSADLSPLVESIGHPEGVLDSAMLEIDESKGSLDRLLMELSQQEPPPTDEQANLYKEGKMKLKELEKRHADLKDSHLAATKRRSEIKSRKMKLLKTILNSDQYKRERTSKQLESMQKLLGKYIPWHLDETSASSFDFLFLSDSLSLKVNISGKIDDDWGKIADMGVSYALRSLITSDRIIPAEFEMYRLFHKLIMQYVSADELSEKYNTFSAMPCALRRLSALTEAARDLLSEFDWISCQVTSCSCSISSEDQCITVTFTPPMTGLDRFQVRFFFKPKESPDWNMLQDLQQIIENGFMPTSHEYCGGRRQMEQLGEYDVSKLLSEVTPGKDCLKRMVETLQRKVKTE